ncbi:MAG TPA: glycosyltransferase family 4 protein, partial [Myxococcota bacterium]|nr:glycosyltransferase family 4 protein [Myxococcota bacterium]
MSAVPAVALGLGPRIALVRSRYDPYGGAERFVQGAVASLRAEGATLTIVTRSWPGHDGSAILLDPFHLGSAWRDRSFARAACAELSRRHFDLVQSHERIECCDVFRAGDGVHAEWLAQRARVQPAWRRWATAANPYHRQILAFERRLLTGTRVRAVICISRMVRDDIVRHYGTAADKLSVIYNGVDARHFHPGLRAELGADARQQLSIPRDAFVAVFVGSGFERKGVPVLLEAVARAGAPVWAVIVGKDKHARRYVERARRLGIAGRVRFVGAASDARPYYAAADCFAMPTLYEPLSNAVLEAMACGLPVLVSQRCGAAELVREGESGYVRDALDTAG